MLVIISYSTVYDFFLSFYQTAILKSTLEKGGTGDNGLAGKDTGV